MNAQPQRSPLVRAQAGVLLLEALIAILIFSLGVLSLVALQATSIKLTSDAKYRTDASLLANRLIGQMWASGESVDTLYDDFDDRSSDRNALKYNYDTWRDEVKGIEGLPGVVGATSGVVSTFPTVRITKTGAATGQVVITLFWRTPEMAVNQPGHQHMVVSQIVRNNP